MVKINFMISIRVIFKLSPPKNNCYEAKKHTLNVVLLLFLADDWLDLSKYGKYQHKNKPVDTLGIMEDVNEFYGDEEKIGNEFVLFSYLLSRSDIIHSSDN